MNNEMKINIDPRMKAKHAGFLKMGKEDLESNEVRKIATNHGGKRVKNGYRFVGKTAKEVNERVAVFIAALPPPERPELKTK
jgi:hypothetical protein